ncbi:MAG: methyltransferase [Clostridiales bacterium]|jgi:tRNA1Val (adenine37-N6)-methyltransferase|nr:methyltransferase [Clostridiales bacterium]
MLEYDGCVVDDLQVNNLRIIQRKGGFKFGSDAVALVNFVNVRPVGVALDIGSGTGIIPILLAGKLGFGTVYGVEIDTDMATLSQQSVQLNNLQNSIKIINAPIQDISQYLSAGSCTVITSNPPFNKVGCGQVSGNDSIAQARFECSLTLQETLKAASYLLSTGGKLYMIHQIYRLAEIMYECTTVRLQPKVIKLVDSKRFLVQCTKDAKVGLLIR